MASGLPNGCDPTTTVWLSLRVNRYGVSSAGTDLKVRDPAARRNVEHDLAHEIPPEVRDARLDPERHP